MYLLIIFLPFFSILSLACFSRFVGKFFFAFNIIVTMLVGVILSIFIYYEVIFLGFSCDLFIIDWFNFGDMKAGFHFYFDPLSVSMLLTIFIISFFVQIFSLTYMWEDALFIKFLIYINLFTFFMVVMVLASNMIQFFLGWEGIGISSYLLINFWNIRPEANRSALKAVFLNKIGDFFLYIAFVYIFVFFRSFDFSTVFLLVKNDICPIFFEFFGFKINKIDFICFFLLGACIGKSAQIGLHSWLPDAMEGPTPVSALLHSATMVTAGIFLILRFSHFFEYSQVILGAMTFIGLITAVFSSFISMGQYDMKKIIAYSTTSQLAYMLIACGSSNYLLAFQHLFDHAFFKAVLFLGAGSLIYYNYGRQDIRQFGGLHKYFSITYITFLIASFSLLGLPGTSGFYSKETIIEGVLLRTSFQEIISLLTAISVSFSAYYSLQLVYIIFFSDSLEYIKDFDYSININFSLFFLSFVGLLGGFIFSEIYSFPSSFFQDSLYFNSSHYEFVENVDDLGWYFIMNLPFYFVFLTIFLLMYFQDFIINQFQKYASYFSVEIFFNRKWFFDMFIFTFFISSFFYCCYVSFFKIFDRAILEFIGPRLIMQAISKIINKVNFFQQGHFYFNIALIIFAIMFFIIITIFFMLKVFINFFLCLILLITVVVLKVFI